MLQDIVSIEVPVSSACPSERFDGLRSGTSHDEPSPTPALDVSFEDGDTNGSESSRSVPRSDESKSCSLPLLTCAFTICFLVFFYIVYHIAGNASPSDANEPLTRSDEDDDAGSVLERVVRLEVEGGRGWVRSMRWELDGITEQIAGTVLEDMVEDAAGDLGIGSPWPEVPTTSPNL